MKAGDSNGIQVNTVTHKGFVSIEHARSFTLWDYLYEF